MNSIWKYQLIVEAKQKIKLPRGAKILSVQACGEDIQAWALIDPAQPTEEVQVRIYGTGHDVPEHEPIANYIGTVQTGTAQTGKYVWHIFMDSIPPVGAI